MERVVQVRVTGANPDDGEGPPGRGSGWAPARPTWAFRLAVITFLVIVALPLLILFGIAVATAALVFGGLALMAAAGRRIRAALPGDDGRSNVRVKGTQG